MSDILLSLSAFGWFWEKYGKDIVDKAGQGLAKKWREVKWPEAEARYRVRVKELHGYTRLLGNPKKIEIEDIYTDVYVLDKPTAYRRFDLSELQSRPLDREQLKPEEKRQPILHLAVKENRLFILGKPGAGKTTFLKYLTLQACAGKLGKTPIFVSLKEWADSGLELLPFIEQLFDICEFPDAGAFIEHLLKDGAALIMFDGLDEVMAEGDQRHKLIQTLTQVAQRYHKTQMCVTCRIAATDYSFTEFTYLEIADFNKTQQRLFAGKWYQGEPKKLDRFLTEFGKPEHEGLRELAQTPLLLALLCLSFDETLAFPSRRVDLYKEALDALLKKWDSSRNIQRDELYRKLSPSRKEQMLARIAAHNFKDGVYFITHEVLVSQIISYLQTLPVVDAAEEPDGEVVLKAIEAQHGILVERAHDIYSFSHLTFQEYYTAHYIVDNAATGTLKALIKNHLTDRRWREVFLLTSSMLDNADDFFEIFLKEIAKWPAENDWLEDWLQWARMNLPINQYPKAKVLETMLWTRIAHSIELTLDRKPTHDDDIAPLLPWILFVQNDIDRHIISTCDFFALFGRVPDPAIDRDIARNVSRYLASFSGIEVENLVEPELDKNRITSLIKFIEASLLLIDCLKLAAVTNRQIIELAAAGGETI